jgi:hypothetical protein
MQRNDNPLSSVLFAAALIVLQVKFGCSMSLRPHCTHSRLNVWVRLLIYLPCVAQLTPSLQSYHFTSSSSSTRTWPLTALRLHAAAPSHHSTLTPLYPVLLSCVNFRGAEARDRTLKNEHVKKCPVRRNLYSVKEVLRKLISISREN